MSISLGLWTFLITYLISVPLGMAKAVREGSRFDVATSLVVLIGYAIPGFVLGVFLIVLFAGGSFCEWFPLRGLTSDNWDELCWPARIADYFWHLTLPLICLVIEQLRGRRRMLTKNTFVEEMRKQYVLVARAKGLSQKSVLYKHIFRNALIPLVTGFPAAFVGAFFAGSLLIETLFSLDGLGLLSYESVVRRDYPVVLGSLYLFTLIGLVVKLVSDLLYVVVDPRVQFGSGGQMTGRCDAAPCTPSPAAPAAGRGAKPMSPNQRAWARFRRNRLGYCVAVDLRGRAAAGHAWPSWSATTGRWWRATTASCSSRCSTTSRRPPSAATSARPPTGRTRSSPSSSPSPATGRSFTLNRYCARHSTNYFEKEPNPAPPSATHWLGTDSLGQDMVARLLYGFRVSIWFALCADAGGHGDRHRRRRAAGLLRRPGRPGAAAPDRDLGRGARAVPADHLRVDLRALAAAAAGAAVAVGLDGPVATTCAPSSCATAASSSSRRRARWACPTGRSSGATCCRTR